jgi:hypothetical protein
VKLRRIKLDQDTVRQSDDNRHLRKNAIGGTTGVLEETRFGERYRARRQQGG